LLVDVYWKRETAPVDESVYTASGDSGTTYRYGTTAQQYIYNWKAGTGGNYCVASSSMTARPLREQRSALTIR
jgi:hypothetical protein